MLGRIPFVFPTDKVREKILRLYDDQLDKEINSLMYNTLKILSQTNNNNLLFLINRIYKHQKADLIESIRKCIVYFNDNEIIQIVMNLVKILPSDDIFLVLYSILTQCTMLFKYSLLTEFIQTHSITKILVGYLKFSEVRCNTICLLQFFLLGYYDSLNIFHEHIREFEKYLVKIIKVQLNSIAFPKVLVELLILLMKKFPGYPERYGKLVELIKEVIVKYHLGIMPESRFEEIIQASNWSSINQKPFTPKNTFGYKGLANLGNSNLNIKLYSLLYELHTPSLILLCKVSTRCSESRSQRVLNELWCLYFRSYPKREGDQINGVKFNSDSKAICASFGEFETICSPKEFRNTLPDYLRSTYAQRDASEFFKVLSDMLEFDAKRVCQRENMFSKHFEGKIKTRIKCDDCKCMVVREEKFLDLFIPVDLPDEEAYEYYVIIELMYQQVSYCLRSCLWKRY
jgi:hypothetical protein